MKRNIFYRAYDKERKAVHTGTKIVDMFDEEDTDEAAQEVRNALLEEGYAIGSVTVQILEDKVYTIIDPFGFECGDTTTDVEYAEECKLHGYTIQEVE